MRNAGFDERRDAGIRAADAAIDPLFLRERLSHCANERMEEDEHDQLRATSGTHGDLRRLARKRCATRVIRGFWTRDSALRAPVRAPAFRQTIKRHKYGAYIEHKYRHVRIEGGTSLCILGWPPSEM
jgi:hypothetical protein